MADLFRLIDKLTESQALTHREYQALIEGRDPETTAYLAKKALLRPVDVRNESPYYANLEQELLEKINALGIGPQGFGGRTTALAVNIEQYPTHIAGLPVAVNINCHVTRHMTEVL